MSLTKKHTEYINWVNELKTLIQRTQIKASILVNRELMSLYWTIGKSISEKVNTANWGSSVVEKLSKDLKEEFPNQKGFSRSNLFSMKKWFEFYSQSDIDTEKIQQLVGQIPWGHNVVIISSLPTPHSELATETLKDPYKFDFLTLQEKALEKDIEIQLVKHITSFLLELGTGFSFVGQQVPVKIDNQDFYIDLLFYHIKLKCYVVVELKAIEFKAEFAGKMNLYLSAIDDSLKTKAENPTIGLLLCKSKSEIIAEYALRGMTQPIGIAEYEISNAIPKEIKTELPTIEEIELATTKAIRNAGDSNK